MIYGSNLSSVSLCETDNYDMVNGNFFKKLSFNFSFFLFFFKFSAPLVLYLILKCIASSGAASLISDAEVIQSTAHVL